MFWDSDVLHSSFPTRNMTWQSDVSQRKKENLKTRPKRRASREHFFSSFRPGKIDEERTFREFIFSGRFPISEGEKRPRKKSVQNSVSKLKSTQNTWMEEETTTTARSLDC